MTWQVPSPLTDEEGDFILIHHEDLRLSQKAEEVYAQLQKMLLEQHEVRSPLTVTSLSVPPAFLRAKAWGTDQIGLDSSSHSNTYWLCDPASLTEPVSSSVKQDENTYPASGWL